MRTVTFKRLYEQELSAWIQKRFLLRKKKAAPQAVELLKEFHGNNLTAIDNEAEKLAVYAAQRPVITAADVNALAGASAGGVDEIIDAMSRNDRGKVFAISAGFQKKDLMAITGLFSWNLRMILKVRECLKEKWPLQKIKEALGLKKFQAEKFIPQAKRLKSSWLKKALSELTVFEFRQKTGGFAGDPDADWGMLMAKLLAAL